MTRETKQWFTCDLIVDGQEGTPYKRKMIEFSAFEAMRAERDALAEIENDFQLLRKQRDLARERADGLESTNARLARENAKLRIEGDNMTNLAHDRAIEIAVLKSNNAKLTRENAKLREQRNYEIKSYYYEQFSNEKANNMTIQKAATLDLEVQAAGQGEENGR